MILNHISILTHSWTVVAVAMAILAPITPATAAGWPSENIAVCNATGDQYYPQGVSDDNGGTLLTWIDKRSGSHAIYAQHITRTGELAWNSNGIPICKPLTDKYTQPQIVSDGHNGAIIAWADTRNRADGIYAQRISSNGTVLWKTNGVAVAPNISVRYSPKIIADGSGGAILVWRGYAGSEYNIYAQRIDNAGNTSWSSSTTPVPVAITPGYKEECELTTDGDGGAIISWYDHRNGNYDIYAQRFNSVGSPMWTVNGIPICTKTKGQNDPRIAADGAGGAIITWGDFRNDEYDVYAQRVDGAGQIQWTLDGVPIATGVGEQWLPDIAADGDGGVIIAWESNRRSSPLFDVYAQRVNADGISLWATNGVLAGPNIARSSFDVTNTQSSGAIIAWKSAAAGQIRVQELTSDGALVNGPDGRLLAFPSSSRLLDVIEDDFGGIIVAWDDTSQSVGSDIFVSQIKQPVIPAAADDWSLFK